MGNEEETNNLNIAGFIDVIKTHVRRIHSFLKDVYPLSCNKQEKYIQIRPKIFWKFSIAAVVLWFPDLSEEM